jgi:ABC-2 type transport system ATP-binding protein
MVSLPSKPVEAPAAGNETAGAATESAAESRPKPTRSPASKSPAKPRAKRAPRKPPVADPGPPPPLPADLIIGDIVVPPKPPLPRPVPEADVADVPVDEVLVEVPSAAKAPVDAEPVAQAPVAEEPVAEQPELEAEPELAAEPQLVFEPVVVVAPEIAELEPAAERDLAVVADIVGDIDTATAALVVKGVSKGFGATRAVDGIDLTVPAGTFYGLVGPNGAGKTTTLSIIAGLLRPDRGSISVNGIDALADPIAAKRQMGVLPDRLRTFDRLTGRQLLHYYGVLRGLPSAVVESRTADLARAFDLTDALGRVVSDYSAGMAKKVMLAGALIHSPRLLVLDEPFEAVDPVSSAIILDILSTYVAHGGTVILSSHGMELVERHCSRVAVIVAGQVLAEGTVEEVRGELTLEQRFIELAGGLSDVEGLEWLHTFSN